VTTTGEVKRKQPKLKVQPLNLSPVKPICLDCNNKGIVEVIKYEVNKDCLDSERLTQVFEGYIGQ